MESLTTGDILGFQPWFAYLVGFLVVLGIGWLYIKYVKKGKILKEQAERIYCTFYLNNGKRRHYWCDIIENEVKLTPEEKKRLDKVTKEYGGYKGDLDKLGAIKVPGDISGDRYFTNTEFIFTDYLYPDKPPERQKEIKTCEFMAGIPLPIIGINSAKWTPDMIEKYQSSLIGAASDTDTIRIINAKDHGLFDNLSKVAQAMQQFPQLKWACFGAVGAAIVGALLNWMTYSAVQVLISLFMPGG